MTSPDSAEPLDAKAIDDEKRAAELLDRFTTTAHKHRVQDLAKAFAEVRRETLDAADRALRAAETPELPEGQAIGLSLAREVLANLAYRLASPEAIRTAEREGA